MPPRRSGAPPSHPLSDRIDEVIGLLLVAYAVFLALSLWTFHPGDPSWSDEVSAGWAVRNYGGTVGAYHAGGLVQVLGIFSALLPIGLLVWGVAAFAGLRSWRPGWRELGGLLVLLSAAGMVYKAFAHDPLFGKTALAGGVVGYGVAVLLETYLGWLGSWVVLAAVFLSVLVATTGLPLGRLFALLMIGPRWAAGPGLALLGRALWAGAAAAGLGLARLGAAAWRGMLPRGGRGEAGRLSPGDAALAEAAGEGVPLADAEPAGRRVRERAVESGGDWLSESLAGPALFGAGRSPREAGRAANGGALNGGASRPAEKGGGGGPALFGGVRGSPTLFLPGPAAGGEPAAPPDAPLPAPPPEERSGPPAEERLPRAEAPPFEEEEPSREAEESREERPPAGLRVGRRRPEAGEEEEPPPGVPPAGEAPDAPGRRPSREGRAEGGAPALDADAGLPLERADGGDPDSSLRVRHAGAEGEMDIVRIEDDAIVREEDRVLKDVSRRKARPKGAYVLPPLDLFADVTAGGIVVDEGALRSNSLLLEQTLREFGVEGQVTEVKTGPVITVYEFAPAPGVKVAKIASLSDDLARALSALSVRIVAPIPGKSVVGIEVPNRRRNAVYVKEILSSREFSQDREKLTLGLGKDILGRTALTDLAKIPHLLIAGTTGSGKSVALNMMICSLLVRCMPREVRFLMIDPKMLELSIYEGVPHLLVPVVTEAKKASAALRGVVFEMERRYRAMSELGARSIESYNERVAKRIGAKEAERRLRMPLSADDPEGGIDFIPYIVVVIDELADLMMISSRDVEESMIRLAQMARAAGIHLMAATQRPSVDVLTGLIKANFPSRIALRVATRTDSRTILDMNGAERLLGKGDMLFIPPGASSPVRIHGAYVSEEEIARLVGFWREQGPAVFREDFFVEREDASGEGSLDDAEYDDRYDDAVALVARTREASISLIQRHLRIGYNRAARMIERMEMEGIIGPADGVRRRQVLIGEIPEAGAG